MEWTRSVRGIWVPLAFVVAAVVVHSVWGHAFRDALELPGEPREPARDPATQLRVVSWNLRNFPDKGQDLSRVGQALDAFAADIVAVQEIVEPAALRRLASGRDVHLSAAGGRGEQRVGFVIDPDRVELLAAPREHAALAMGGRVRPALSVYVRDRVSGFDFHVVVVHLKARPDGLSMRREQWRRLAALVSALALESGDPDVLVVGDFNTTDAPAELEEAAAALASAGLVLLSEPSSCSAYWEGRRRDAWKEPSLLDLAWGRGALAAGEGRPPPPVAHAHCARHRCAAFRSTPAMPDLDYRSASDHCPVVVDLPVRP